MNKLLIVNADDFGLSKALNYGVIETFVNGVVTSTTAMVNASAIEHAAELSANYPKLAIGMHFVLSYGRPLSDMPGLVRENGKLGKWLWEQAETGILPLEEIQRELECQYSRFVEIFDRPPTHIDSHHHAHMIEQIFPIVAAFAREKNVPLRVDHDAMVKSGIKSQWMHSTQGFDGGFYGDSVTESLFLETLDRSIARGESSLEVMCHPSFIDNEILASRYCNQRLVELNVLTSSSLKYAIAERGYRLGTFRDL
ncbi:chitin disaccharide deacetylase [Aeromonas jandaei]